MADEPASAEPVNLNRHHRHFLRSGLLLVVPVYPGGGWQLRRLRLAGEALRVGGVGGGEHRGAAGLDLAGPAVVNVGGGVQAKPAVPVLVVVPGEEDLAVRAGVLDAGEPAL